MWNVNKMILIKLIIILMCNINVIMCNNINVY